jgi:glycosyltransferase involved in cell wall biosynthesis
VEKRERPLRIAMLAPPWLPIPAPAYGGIESVVHLLTDQLVEDGHDVVLFCAPGSDSRADTVEVLEREHPGEIGLARHEAAHVGAAFEAIAEARAQGRPFDVVHDHCGFTALALGPHLGVPIVHTAHGPFDETGDFYRRFGRNGTIVALSRSQLDDAPAMDTRTAVVPNPICVADWPFQERKGDYLLWIGRLEEVKGPHRAIEAARRAGVRLVLAGPVQPGKELFFSREIEPHLDGDRITYAGEVGGDQKKKLYAEARGMLMPIRWHEPFGMVMIEAMACGTPVIAFSEGAATDIVIPGENGFLVDDEHAMADAIGRLDEIDPGRCRELVDERFDVRRVAALYANVYRDASAAVPQGNGHKAAALTPSAG